MTYATSDEHEAATIVLIEDDAGLREACRDLLSLNGYSVATAETGVSGVRLVCDSLPDLVVTDIVLPDLDGRDVVRILNAYRPTRDIPIIAATAERAVPGPRETGLFVAVLHKPFAPGQLLACVKQFAVTQPT